MDATKFVTKNDDVDMVVAWFTWWGVTNFPPSEASSDPSVAVV